MIFTAGLDCLCPVKLFQNHNSGQMVGEGHEAHGQLKISLFLDPGSYAEGGTNEKAGAAFAG